MPKYTVRFARSARRELEALPDAAINRIFPRIGNHRVVYQIADAILLVEVRAIGDRKDIYG